MFGKNLENVLIEYAKREALGDYTLLEKSVPLVNDMANTLENRFNKNTSREEVVEFLAKKLENNESYLGTWVGFEPGEFDGKDWQFEGAEHSDAYGRFVPYCYRDENNEIKVVPLENIDAEAFYYTTKDNNRLTILDPFTYEIEGEDVLMTCVAQPVRSGNDIIGVTGVDIQLKSAKEIYHELIDYKTGMEEKTTQELSSIMGNENNKTKRVLAYAVKAMVGNHNEILSELQNSSQALIDNAEKLSHTSEETKRASQELAKTTERLTNKVTEQSDYTEDTEENMNKLNEMVQENTKILEELQEVINEAVNAKQEGEASVTALRERAGDIQEIVDKIKLLSLNASVEAARAGKEGKSFAVVAAEIRDLSKQSYEALDSIMQVMEDIQNKFSSISQAIDQTGEAVNRVSESGQSIKSIEDETKNKIKELSTIAEENASSIEEASSVAEEQSNASEELERIAKSLYQTVYSLKETLQKLST